MKKILLINAGKSLGESQGNLNASLHNVAKDTLESLGLEIMQTHIDKGYNIGSEITKLEGSDVWIWQFPGWWMGEPWIMKKYIDEVFYNATGRLFRNDGRSKKDANKKYGSGGLSQGKKYMFSSTWNAPLEAFTQEGQFFEKQGIDGVFFHLHKAHHFLGMESLPSFTCNDVHKNPQFESYKRDYINHLKAVFNK